MTRTTAWEALKRVIQIAREWGQFWAVFLAIFGLASYYFPGVRRWSEIHVISQYAYVYAAELRGQPEFNTVGPNSISHPAWSGGLNLNRLFDMEGDVTYVSGQISIGRDSPGLDGEITRIYRQNTCLYVKSVEFVPYIDQQNGRRRTFDPISLKKVLEQENDGSSSIRSLKNFLPSELNVECGIGKGQCGRIAIWLRATRVTC